MEKIKQNKERKIAFALEMIAILFCFFTMLYHDNIINSGLGYNMVKSIYEGSFSYFLSVFDWAYGVSIYIIYAIWSIPVLIVGELFRINNIQECLITLLWYKLLLGLFAIWSVCLVKKIANEITEVKEEVELQYIGSIFFIFPVFAIAQCDIISVCFVLLGVYAYIKEQNIRFVIYFGLAITMKYFALLVFIPLVLFRYRRIRKIFTVFFIGILLAMLTMMVTKRPVNDSLYLLNESNYVNEHIVKFASVVLDTNGNGQIGLWAVFYMIICIIAYIVPNHDEKEKVQYALWFVMAGYMCFFLFYPCNFYWYILIAPFMMLVSYGNTNKTKINLLLEIFFTIAVIICSVYTQNWVLYGQDTFAYLLFKNQAIAVKTNAFQYFIENVFHMQLAEYLPIFRGIAVACGLAFTFINFPGLKIEYRESIDDKKEIRNIIWMRIALLYFWIAIGIYCLAASQNEYYFSNQAVIAFISGETEEIADDLMTEEKKNRISTAQCEYEGKVKFIDGDAWMRDSFTTILHTKDEIEQDIRFSIYGYTVSGNTPITVYVGEKLVGTLQKEDENQNLTNRYIVIPKEYYAGMRDIKITITAQPELTVEDDVPISITLNKIEVILNE